MNERGQTGSYTSFFVHETSLGEDMAFCLPALPAGAFAHYNPPLVPGHARGKGRAIGQTMPNHGLSRHETQSWARSAPAGEYFLGALPRTSFLPPANQRPRTADYLLELAAKLAREMGLP